jgi:hypothetical protein
VVANAWDHKPLGDGVLMAAGIGAITGGVTGGIGKYGGKILSRVLRRGGGVAKDAEGAAPAICPLSFSPDTPVATLDGGEQAIGTLQVGDHVLAYDPATGKASAQTVEHVWINHDTDLLDLTLRTISDSPKHTPADANGKQQEAELAAHGLRAPPADEQAARQAEADRQGQPDAVNGAAHASVARAADETVHTTAKHPWLTADRGWVKAGELHVGERVVRLDGTTAVVTAEHVVPGAANYYNLTVSHLHTYLVGIGKYVVHNSCKGQKLARSIGKRLGPDDAPHHVIPCECDQNDLVLLAQKDGFRLNNRANGRALARDPANAALRNEPSHPYPWGPGGFHSQYNNYVLRRLNSAYRALGRMNALTPANAHTAIRRIIVRANRYIDREGRLYPGAPLR